MSIVLVVDGACDLPKKFLDERNILLFPFKIEIDGKTYIDDKMPHSIEDFYSKGLLTLEHEADSVAFTPDQMQESIEENVFSKYDYAIIQTASKARSIVYENCIKAQPKILKSYRAGIDSGEQSGYFGMRVMNSSTLFAGQGVLAAFTSDIIAAGKSKQDTLRLAEAMKGKLYSIAAVPDVAYLRERARKKGEDSLSALGAFLAKSLNITPIIQVKDDLTFPVDKVRGFENAVNKIFESGLKRLEKGLLCPYVVVSIAGDIRGLQKYDSFNKLEAAAQANNIKLLVCHMGLTSGLNAGPGTISLALATEFHDFE